MYDTHVLLIDGTELKGILKDWNPAKGKASIQNVCGEVDFLLKKVLNGYHEKRGCILKLAKKEGWNGH